MVSWPNGLKERPPISSPFGMRVHPITGRRTLHAGTDFVGFRLVRAIAPGTVRVVGAPSGWAGGGTQVWIQHEGYFTRSMHLASAHVRVGQQVAEGEALGVMGATGAVTGVHAHVEVTPGTVHYMNTGQVDPVPFIQSRLAAPSGEQSGEIDLGEEDMQTRAGFQFVTDDKVTGNVVVDTMSGFYHEWYSNGASYNANTFRGFGIDIKDVPKITKRQRDVMLKDAQALRDSHGATVHVAGSTGVRAVVEDA